MMPRLWSESEPDNRWKWATAPSQIQAWHGAGPAHSVNGPTLNRSLEGPESYFRLSAFCINQYRAQGKELLWDPKNCLHYAKFCVFFFDCHTPCGWQSNLDALSLTRRENIFECVFEAAAFLSVLYCVTRQARNHQERPGRSARADRHTQVTGPAAEQCQTGEQCHHTYYQVQGLGGGGGACLGSKGEVWG